MTFKEDVLNKLQRLDKKICCIKSDIASLLSEDILAALNGANNPNETNVFITQEDLNNYDPITVVANYAALPDPTTVSGEFYWAEAAQGTEWLPGTLGGTYYNAGIYYSNGVSWSFINTPYQATQLEVDTGTNDNKFVTSLTLRNSNQWSNYQPKVRTNTVSSSATPSIDTDTTDIFTITALAIDITSFTTNLTGTPLNGQKLIIRIKDDGTPRTITWGASFASRGGTLLATTVANKTSYVGLIYNSTESTWDCVATTTEA